MSAVKTYTSIITTEKVPPRVTSVCHNEQNIVTKPPKSSVKYNLKIHVSKPKIWIKTRPNFVRWNFGCNPILNGHKINER